MLIGVLGILLAAAVLIGSLMSSSLGRARQAQADTDTLRLENAAESGAHMMLARLPPEAFTRGQAHTTWVIDGQRVEVSVQMSDGLINLRTPSPLRDKLIGSLFGSEAGPALAALNRLAAEGGLVSYAQLARLPGMQPARLRLLLAQSSAFDDHQSPAPAHAPPAVKRLLAPEAPPKGEAIEPIATNAIGKVLQVRARASKDQRASRLLLMEARLTGQQPQPVWVYDWLWLDAGPVTSAAHLADIRG